MWVQTMGGRLVNLDRFDWVEYERREDDGRRITSHAVVAGRTVTNDDGPAEYEQVLLGFFKDGDDAKAYVQQLSLLLNVLYFPGGKN